MRWSSDKSRRFQILRAAEAQGSLAEAQLIELARLLDDLDADEANDLQPAIELARTRTEDLTAERVRLEAQADALARIVAEQEGLLADAAAYLEKLRAKNAALIEDYQRLMGRDLISAQ